MQLVLLLLTALATSGTVSAVRVERDDAVHRQDKRLLGGLISSLTGSASSSKPTVTLDYAAFSGKTSSGVELFLGMPYAAPPTGTLRYRKPASPVTKAGVTAATSYGKACPQTQITNGLLGGIPSAIIDTVQALPFLQGINTDSEDCLNLNVARPAGTKAGKNLPVVVWIFGGGFQFGATSQFDPTPVVAKSISLSKPVVYVSMDFRQGGFGFLGGDEVKAAGVGNLGLWDQRAALLWVQKYISLFGGDPTKVTLWGQSSGAMSASFHMLHDPATTLFRGSVMHSGAPIPVGDISKGQRWFDFVVDSVGCSAAADKLDCLRDVSYSSLKFAIDQTPGLFSYNALSLSWIPRVDGDFFTDTPPNLVLAGHYAKVPMISGNMDDEASIFALASINTTSDAQAMDYFHENYVPGASDAQIDEIAALYPSDIQEGSPYSTGILNALTPQFKRLASLQGDIAFQAPRRLFLTTASKTQKTWSYLNKRLKLTPFLGSFHSSDVLTEFYAPITGTLSIGGLVGSLVGQPSFLEYVLNFVTDLDPGSRWPQWTSESPTLMTFTDFGATTSQDTYRLDGTNAMTALTLQHPL